MEYSKEKDKQNQKEEHDTRDNIVTLKHTLNTRRKLLFIYSLFLFTPIISLATGSPLPFPYSLFQVTEIQAQLIETISYTLGIIATISAGIFYLKRGSDNTHKETRQQITEAEARVCARIDNKFNILMNEIHQSRENLEELHNQKLSLIHNQITNLRETDVDIKRNINRLENRIFGLKEGEGSPL